MGRFLLGILAGAALGYACSQKMDKESMTKVCDSTNRFFDKAKKKFKDGWYKGKNEAEYMTDRVENMVNNQ